MWTWPRDSLTQQHLLTQHLFPSHQQAFLLTQASFAGTVYFAESADLLMTRQIFC